MIDTARPPPFFVADDLALDSLNCVAAPWKKEIEWLSDGQDLLSWLEHAHLVPTSVLADFKEKTGAEALNAVAAQARALREWLRGFVAAHAGKALDASVLAELDAINRLLAQDSRYQQIEALNLSTQDLLAQSSSPANPETSKRGLYQQPYRHWHKPEDLLLVLAQAISNLICNVGFEYVKNCEGPTCTLWFYDVSKNHTRRWCSMAVCGNRAKAAAHRAKKRSADAAAD